MNDDQRPTEEELRGAPVLPGFELPDGLWVSRGTWLGDGLEPEDIGFIGFLKLRDPRIPATKDTLREEMQGIGWKMGKARFNSCFQRLKAAGHIKHTPVYNEETGRPEWRIEYFLNPANNDQYVNSGIQAFPQVGAENPVSGVSQKEQLFENLVTGISAGQTGSQVSGVSDSETRFSGFRTEGVPAGQGRNSGNPVSGSPPPYPPEGGGGTPPPNPRTKGRAPKADRHAELCALDEGDYEPTADEIAAADAFLQDLPGKWQHGPEDARALAPLLASRTHTQGYELDTLLELILIQDDKDKPATRPTRVMPYRVRNLKRKRTEEKPVPGDETASSGLAAWCGECNRGEEPAETFQRTRELPDGRDVPCTACHPKYTRV